MRASKDISYADMVNFLALSKHCGMLWSDSLPALGCIFLQSHWYTDPTVWALCQHELRMRAALTHRSLQGDDHRRTTRSKEPGWHSNTTSSPSCLTIYVCQLLNTCWCIVSFRVQKPAFSSDSWYFRVSWHYWDKKQGQSVCWRRIWPIFFFFLVQAPCLNSQFREDLNRNTLEYVHILCRLGME